MNPIKNRRNKWLRLGLSIFTVVVILLLAMFNSGNAVLRSISGFFIVPVQQAATATFRGIGNFFSGFSNNQKMKKELDEARAELARADAMEQLLEESNNENENLRALLGEQSKHPALSFTYAEVIAKSVDTYTLTFTLNKGSRQGIKKDMPVISVGGLAGRIIEVAPDYSILLALVDSRSSVPALGERSRDTGIIKGLQSTGQASNTCVMTQLPAEAKLLPGDTVVSSGMGGVFPKGLALGKVTELTVGEGLQSLSAVIKPSVDFNHLECVLIITGGLPNG